LCDNFSAVDGKILTALPLSVVFPMARCFQNIPSDDGSVFQHNHGKTAR